MIYGHVFNSSPVRRVNGIIEPAGARAPERFGAAPRSRSLRAKNFCDGRESGGGGGGNRFREEWKSDVLEFSTGGITANYRAIGSSSVVQK